MKTPSSHPVQPCIDGPTPTAAGGRGQAHASVSTQHLQVGRRRLAAGLGLLAFAVAGAGCHLLPEPSSDPTRHYTLDLPTAAAALPARTEGAPNIGVQPIELPAYLRKGLLVTRRGETEVFYNDYQRWAEPFEQGMARLLRQQLQADARLGVVSLPPYPFDLDRQYDVTVRIRQAEGQLGEGRRQAGLRFVAEIELHSTGAGSRLLASRVYEAPSSLWKGEDFPSLAKALSEAVRLLSMEVSAMLAEQGKATNPPETK